MENKENPPYYVACKLLALAYYRCFILYQKPNKGLDNGENMSITECSKTNSGEKNE